MHAPSDHGHELYPVFGDTTLPMVKNASHLEVGNVEIEVDGTSYLNIVMTSPKLVWKMLVLVPMDELQQGVTSTRNFTILITGIILIMAILLSFIPSGIGNDLYSEQVITL